MGATTRRLSTALLSGALLAAAPASAQAATDLLRVTAEQDTFVSEDVPDRSFATSSGLWVDAAARHETYLRFWVAGLSGRTVTGARLRLRQLDRSAAGGRVFAMRRSGWSEAVTWSGRPALDGALQHTFGAVEAGETHTAALDPALVRPGLVSFGLDSVHPDGARWASRESATPPQLELEVETPDGFEPEGMSIVALPDEGSSDPTSTGTSHRLAATARGRLLAVHGRHAGGPVLAWRDPAGGWSTRTRGAADDGTLQPNTATGDWDASIAVVRGPSGAEEAWVVWAGPNADADRSVRVRRITGLDDPAGPALGPLVEADDGARGAFRPDLAVTRAADGTARVCLLWSRRAADSRFEVVTAWLDAGDATPAVTSEHVLYRSGAASRWGTLVASGAGVHALVRGSRGRLTPFLHTGGTWTQGARGPYISSRSAPAGAPLPDGGALVAVEHDVTRDETVVLRVGADGAVVPEATFAGLRAPTITADGERALVVGVASATGHLVSRERDPAGAWSAEDRVELGTEARGRLKHPNAVRVAGGRLRVIAEGRDGRPHRSSVLAYERPL